MAEGGGGDGGGGGVRRRGFERGILKRRNGSFEWRVELESNNQIKLWHGSQLSSGRWSGPHTLVGHGLLLNMVLN